ncbi:hypothetical protein LAJ19_19955 (plasmid) [Deinococcus taeanensis]|uniref:hypothetical protein n=1 Tax=Deinococcus taeanensis TaxID=2737050 RepID=UPI001CDC2606|nr:hypothetical protein [Deinococcus taeanensis]UBV45408.1 hypothetical protein LAJ19_19955 [Deinococcus taeanensis]
MRSGRAAAQGHSEVRRQVAEAILALDLHGRTDLAELIRAWALDAQTCPEERARLQGALVWLIDQHGLVRTVRA